ncbi:MaoC/PaaZ C-terminal domain-containing protein [Thermaurantiacus tibetensis]|uniref:MaoC/PaaZ C-terminal domain-containing protein n=1 Tax=Thermaurantiacus tibetensis TaxID=2759035 RepID=UPI0018904849|nr:MaoC/PaaZ C-terminal domain-containing protein [Thermaurantiacus tibetensis]
MRSFDDFAVGDMVRMGPSTVGHLEAQDFARRYDPQPYLLSEEGARDHPIFARMAVSGWLVSAIVNRLIVDDLRANPAAVLAMPGVERLRWVRPVYPGDHLMVEAEVVSMRRLASWPGIGLVRQKLRARNGDGKLVLTAVLALLVSAPERTTVLHRMIDD